MSKVKGGGRLPAEYQEVEYLSKHSMSSPDAEAYINTLVTGNNVTRIHFSARAHDVRAYNYFFGNYINEESNTTRAIIGASGNTLLIYLNNIASQRLYTIPYVRGNYVDVDYNRSRLIANGAEYVPGELKNGNNNNSNIVLFHSKASASTGSNPNLIDCNFFQFWDESNVLIRNYVPCYRKSDNKPGMYDLCGSICPLTGTPFYINAGRGEFAVGPDV